MASILGWFLDLSTALNIGRKIISASGLISLSCEIFRFLTAFEQK